MKNEVILSFFWFNLFLEARAEILKKFSWFYGRFEDTKRHFENNRSLGNISFKVTDDILASQNAKVAIENNSNGKNVANLQETQVMNDISKAPEDKDAIVKNDDKTDQKDSNSIAQINNKG